MNAGVRQNPVACELLSQGKAEGVVRVGGDIASEKFEAEKTSSATTSGLLNETKIKGPERGYHDFPCQIRIDWLSPEHGIIDLKTCDDLDHFESDARKYRYIHQLAFYQAVLEAAITERNNVERITETTSIRPNAEFPVYIVAVAKKEPLPLWHPDYVAPQKSIETASNKVEADDPILSGVESQRKRNEFARWYKKEELCCGHCTLRYEEDGVVICGASGEPTEANGKICNTFDKRMPPVCDTPKPVVNGPIDLEKDKDLNEDKSGKVHRHYKPYASRGAIQVKLPPNNIHEFVQLLIHHFERPYLKEVIPLLQRRVAHPEEDEQ